MYVVGVGRGALFTVQSPPSLRRFTRSTTVPRRASTSASSASRASSTRATWSPTTAARSTARRPTPSASAAPSSTPSRARTSRPTSRPSWTRSPWERPLRKTISSSRLPRVRPSRRSRPQVHRSFPSQARCSLLRRNEELYRTQYVYNSSHLRRCCYDRKFHCYSLETELSSVTHLCTQFSYTRLYMPPIPHRPHQF